MLHPKLRILGQLWNQRTNTLLVLHSRYLRTSQSFFVPRGFLNRLSHQPCALFLYRQITTTKEYKMESEERPAKMRKIEQDPDTKIEATTDGAPSSIGLNQAQNDQPAEDQAPVTTIGTESATETAAEKPQEDESAPKLSKNQLKKQRRLERWEAGREDRKVKRKEKIKEKKERKREAWAQERSKANEDGSSSRPPPSRPLRHSAGDGIQVPITVIFDCDFEDLMFDNELKSLGLQITRCYSDNRKAALRAHLAVSSFGGKMKERFDGILAKQYTSWKGVRFFEEDFVEVAEKSKEWMKDSKGGVIAGALKSEGEAKEDKDEGEGDDQDANVMGDEQEGEIVYLSSESENTLTHLKPYSTYIIGGLVDKNRYKGICYKRALDRGVKTAKLPIGEFLHMKSRQVLVTNHVLEIMLKWMEFGDWGKAFMEVIPKRKGGVLKEADEEGENDEDVKNEEDEVMVEEETGEPARNEVGEAQDAPIELHSDTQKAL